MQIQSLSLSNLTLTRRAGDFILRETSYEFPSEGVVQLQGLTGSGISTILEMLAGLIEPTSGAILVNGKSMASFSKQEFRDYQLSLGFGFDQGGLLSNLSLRDNLLVPLYYHSLVSRSDAEKRVNEYLQRFQISEKDAAQRPSFVSSGIRKSCALARTFLMNPSMLILDEPTQGLHRDAIARLVATINAHQTHKGLKLLITATEDPFFLDQFDHHVVEVKDNNVYWAGRFPHVSEVSHAR